VHNVAKDVLLEVIATVEAMPFQDVFDPTGFVAQIH
jgi:hypothetical protein